MAEKKTLLVLRLEGSLQSWGEMAKWDFRDTSSLPSKSGIVGLLGCAMGLERGNVTLAELSKAISVAVRADRSGTKFVDFHTVHGNPLLSAIGKPRDGSDTIITPREYIQDGCFTVFIEAEDPWRNRIIAALNAPKWLMYLGRKSCVPSRPVFECVTDEYTSLTDAVMNYPICDRAHYPITYELEGPNQTGASIFRPDELIRDRQFGMRRVWRGVIEENEEHVSD